MATNYRNVSITISGIPYAGFLKRYMRQILFRNRYKFFVAMPRDANLRDKGKNKNRQAKG